MSTVSQDEWLRRTTGEAELEDLDEDLGQHNQDEGTRGRISPAPRRGSFRHQARGGTVEPSTGNVPQYPDALPGAAEHIDHKAQQVPLKTKLDVGPAKPYYDGMMAHGVPATAEHGGRIAPKEQDRAAIEANRIRETTPVVVAPSPVPVYIVPESSGPVPLLRTAFHTILVPAKGTMPVQVCPKNTKRSQVSFLNESASTGIRLLADPTDGTGALLPESMNQYQAIAEQDAIWAVSDTSTTAYLSVIDQYSVPGGA